jgi:superfamily II DNA or RNA helicase
LTNKLCVNGWVQYPAHLLNENQKENFKSSLTYVSPFANEDGSYKTILLYKEDENYFSLPIAWTKRNLPTIYRMALENDLRVTTGTLTYTKLPDPNHPSVKDPAGQKQFMDDLLNAVSEHESVLAVAKTGSGKTVCALKAAALLGHRTLVLVDKNDLKEQWIREIQDKLGIPRERIGVIQQDLCEVEGKDIVIGLLQTNARRDYSEEVYNAFGTVIVDECDVLSTEFFNEILPKFNARYRICLTATPNRKDGSDIVLFYHVGEVAVRSQADVLPVKVHVFKYYKEGKLWGSDERQHMLAISKDKAFNEIVARRIYDCYQAGRNILVVAERIDHVEQLMSMVNQLGVPKEDLGQFTDQISKYDRTYEWKKIGRRKTSLEEKELAKTKRIVFATIQMVKRHVDVPRWDTLIEAIPFWQGEQLLGRIRRSYKGKKFPIAMSWRHMKSSFAEDRYYSRYKEYVRCDAQIIHH